MNNPHKAYVVGIGPTIWKNQVAHREAAIATGGQFGQPFKIIAKYPSFEAAQDVLKRSIAKWHSLKQAS